MPNETNSQLVSESAENQLIPGQTSTGPVLPPEMSKKKGSAFGWAVLGFFFPLVGLILFLVWIGKKENKRKSTASGIGALVGFVLQFLLAVFIGASLIFLNTRANVNQSSQWSSSQVQNSPDDQAKLQEIADGINANSAQLISQLGGLYSSMNASVGDNNTLIVSLTFTKTVDNSVTQKQQSLFKSLFMPFVKPLFTEANDAGIKNLNFTLELRNPDGSEIMKVPISQSDMDNYNSNNGDTGNAGNTGNSSDSGNVVT